MLMLIAQAATKQEGYGLGGWLCIGFVVYSVLQGLAAKPQEPTRPNYGLVRLVGRFYRR